MIFSFLLWSASPPDCHELTVLVTWWPSSWCDCTNLEYDIANAVRPCRVSKWLSRLRKPTKSAAVANRLAARAARFWCARQCKRELTQRVVAVDRNTSSSYQYEYVTRMQAAFSLPIRRNVRLKAPTDIHICILHGEFTPVILGVVRSAIYTIP